MKPKKNNVQPDTGKVEDVLKTDPGNGKINEGIEAELDKENVFETEKEDIEPAGAEQKKTNLMYIGPEIKGLVKHAVVFDKGVLPEKVRKAIENYKPMEELFVTLDDMPKALMEIKYGTGSLAVIYKNVEKRFNEAMRQ